MSDISRIEQSCIRLAKIMDAQDGDEIVLLRAARTLKRLHGDLRRAVWTHARENGEAGDVSQAGVGLCDVERDLRSVLLAHPAVETQQIRQHLRHALEQSFETLDMLR
jgi:hypothetical protein